MKRLGFPITAVFLSAMSVIGLVILTPSGGTGVSLIVLAFLCAAVVLPFAARRGKKTFLIVLALIVPVVVIFLALLLFPGDARLWGSLIKGG